MRKACPKPRQAESQTVCTKLLSSECKGKVLEGNLKRYSSEHTNDKKVKTAFLRMYRKLYDLEKRQVSLSAPLNQSWIQTLHSVTLVVSGSLRPHGLWSTRLLCPWDFPGKNTGVGCNALLQGIFLNQRLNLCLLHGRQFFTIEPPGKARARL